LDRGLGSLQTGSNIEFLKTIRDEPMINEIGVLVAGTKDHISIELQKSLESQKSLGVMNSGILVAEEENLRKWLEVSRELKAVTEARQKLQMTYWGKDRARQKEPLKDERTSRIK
jgi:hypothetical protein